MQFKNGEYLKIIKSMQWTHRKKSEQHKILNETTSEVHPQSLCETQLDNNFLKTKVVKSIETFQKIMGSQAEYLIKLRYVLEPHKNNLYENFFVPKKKDLKFKKICSYYEKKI